MAIIKNHRGWPSRMSLPSGEIFIGPYLTVSVSGKTEKEVKEYIKSNPMIEKFVSFIPDPPVAKPKSVGPPAVDEPVKVPPKIELASTETKKRGGRKAIRDKEEMT